MSKDQYENILSKLAEIKEEIEAIPDSSANGQLIDATAHIRNSAEHLKRYYAMNGGKQ